MKRRLLRIAQVGSLVAVVRCRGWRRKLIAWFVFEFFRLYPTLRRNNDWHGKIITRFQTTAKEVWLTIDDGPDEKTTPAILALLEKYQAKVTFFVVGKNVEAHPELCRQILNKGHQLGCHTQSHPVAWWWTLPSSCIRHEIQQGNASIYRATQSLPTYFRSPVGMTPAAVHPYLAKTGQDLIGWSLSAADGIHPSPKIVTQTLRQQLFPGAILLMHEGGNRCHSVESIEAALICLSGLSYRCVLPTKEQFL